jgi:hypothetical protein
MDAPPTDFLKWIEKKGKLEKGEEKINIINTDQ